MLVMNGIAAIAAIRQGAYCLPIIACSSNSEYEEQCLAVGADEFLVKPVAVVNLKEKLEEFPVKRVVLYKEGESLLLHRIGPADNQELNELMLLFSHINVCEKSCLMILFRVIRCWLKYLTVPGKSWVWCRFMLLKYEKP